MHKKTTYLFRSFLFILKTKNLNDRLFMAERALLDPKGTLGRAARKHIIFAPGFFNSYVYQKTKRT